MNYSQTLTQLLERRDLTHVDMLELMHHIMGGQLTAAQIAAVLVVIIIIVLVIVAGPA